MATDFGSPNLSAKAVRLVDVNGNVLANGPSTASRIASAAGSNNATVAKASPGQLFHINGLNAAAAVRWIKFYNKITAPAPATDTALLMATFALAASVPFSIPLGLLGLYFPIGISYALVTGSADADNTSVTAADILGLNVLYA